MSRLIRRFAGTATVLAALLAASACSSLGNDEDDQATCDSVKQELRSVTTQAAGQVTNPLAESETYRDGAARVRAFGKQAHGDVADASFDIADEMDHLGNKATLEGSPDNPAELDLTPLNKAGAKLQSACS